MALFKKGSKGDYLAPLGVLIAGLLMAFFFFYFTNARYLTGYEVYDGFAQPEKEMSVRISEISNNKKIDSKGIDLLQFTQTRTFSSEEELQEALNQIQETIQLSPGEIGSAQIVYSEECSYAGSAFSTSATYFGENGVQTTTYYSPESETSFVKQEGCNYQGESIQIASSVGGGEIVIVDDETDNAAAKISIDKNNFVKIAFSQGEEPDVLLSPAPIGHCFNQQFDPDQGELLMDCSDFGGPCDVCDYGTAKQDKFPFFFWVLLLFNVYTLFYLNMVGPYSISKIIDKGERHLRNKDFQKAIAQYNSVLRYYPTLDDETKNFIKDKAMNYYLALKKELSGVGIAVYKPIYPGELPELVYNDKKIGLVKIDHDSQRVKKLISEGLADWRNGHKSKVMMRKKIIDEIYNKLSYSEKKEIERIYDDYLEEIGFR